VLNAVYPRDCRRVGPSALWGCTMTYQRELCCVNSRLNNSSRCLRWDTRLLLGGKNSAASAGSCAQWFGRTSSHNKSHLFSPTSRQPPGAQQHRSRSLNRVLLAHYTHPSLSAPTGYGCYALLEVTSTCQSRVRSCQTRRRLPSTCPSSKLQLFLGTRPSTEPAHAWPPSPCLPLRRSYLRCPTVACPSPTFTMPPTRRYAQLPWAGRDSGLTPASNATSPMASLPRRSRCSRSMMLRVVVMDSDDEALPPLHCKRSSKPPGRARLPLSRPTSHSEESMRTLRPFDNGRNTTERCSLHLCSTLRASRTR
jgi:hypothetical protein